MSVSQLKSASGNINQNSIVLSPEGEVRATLERLLHTRSTVGWRGWLSEKRLRRSLLPTQVTSFRSWLPVVIEVIPYGCSYHRNLLARIRKDEDVKRVTYDAMLRAIAFMLAVSEDYRSVSDAVYVAERLGARFVAPDALPYTVRFGGWGK